MGKVAAKRRLGDNEAKASLKSLRVSPQKLGLVAESIRGLHVEEAIIQLTFSRKAVARDVKKVLESAIANAENNHNLDIDNLYISEILVGKSLTMKRIRPRARGRAFRIIKPFSNLAITVRENQEEI